ncbi:hypothetical protein Pan97_24640 [Bremerella volcania]|uniref:Uncharacterized protein n=1 Tax=Bremerella volcania TaxID=2527984 RepID=A0A518C897_9BACT|nr:hypothetical protein [Bremerella volcania]QDU75432.1 hypothetical protein Pan97_24640 [Bremerella volcania]
MTNPDQQRLKELQALTQTSHQPTPLINQVLSSTQGRFTPDHAVDEPSDDFSSVLPESDQPTMQQEVSAMPRNRTGTRLLPTFPTVSPPSSKQSDEIASRVQQSVSTTLQLRDQREFKLTLEEDTSRDDALVERLAEQTVSIVQQRDEMLYQRVMQAIEQRLAQGRHFFT